MPTTTYVAGTLARTDCQDGMNFVPEGLVNNCTVLAGIADALVHGLADVDPIVEQSVHMAFAEWRTFPRCDSHLAQVLHDYCARPDLGTLRKD